jgi:hypothetical protein
VAARGRRMGEMTHPRCDGRVNRARGGFLS